MNTAVLCDSTLSPTTAWLTDFDQACVNTISDPIPRGLMRLRSWPELGEVPESLLAPVVRICALLWSKPTATYLVARVTGEDPTQTAALLRVMRGYGYVEMVAGQESDTSRSVGDLAAQAAVAAPPTRSGFIGKFWQRLLG